VFREILDRKFTFESFGVRVTIESNKDELLEKASEVAESALLGKLKIIENRGVDLGHRFGVGLDESGTFYLFQNGEQTNYTDLEFHFFKNLNSMIRLIVAENAENRVFVHAGVVGWKGKAVVLPGSSHRGKTTLVTELIRNGADYYSDEYAIFDHLGLVHPFPRDLTVRGAGTEFYETSVRPQSLGAKIGEVPINVGAVLLTEFRKNSKWKPQIIRTGEGILQTIPHTIPLHADTKFSLKVLNIAFKRAIIAKSFRGDAKTEVVKILSFLDKHLDQMTSI